MKVFISVDLEGVSGTTDQQEMRAGRDSFDAARRWMTSDANAAIRGAFEGGATDVVVCDSHGSARNLLLEELDPRARLVKGLYKPRRMVQGLDSTFDVALLVGYHARAGAGPGVLNHTWIGKELIDLRVNGEPAGELRIVGEVAASFGVPIGLVTGDDVACREALELWPDVRTVVTKEAVDRFAASVIHPSVTARRIQEAAAEVVDAPPPHLDIGGRRELAVEVRWSSSSIAQMCALVPGVEVLDDPTSIRFVATDAITMLGVLVVVTTLATAVGQQPPYS